MSLFYQILNVAILLGGVFWLLQRKMAAYFAAQREALSLQMNAAAAELEKIEKEYQEVSKKLENLQSHLAELKAQSELSLKREAARTKQDTEAFVLKLQKDSELRMAQDLEKTKRSFQKDLVEAAMASARAELNSKLTKQDEAWTVKMVSEVLASEKRERANYAS